MIAVAVPIAFAMMTVALVLNFYRLLRGPDRVDRIAALDTMYINTVALLVLLGVARDTSLFFEGALIIAMMGFVGTVALSKYLLRGDIVE